MNRQVEAAILGSRAQIVQVIKPLFDQLPTRFKYGELETLAGFSKSPLRRLAVGSVLRNSFGCRQVGSPGKQFWLKPSQENSQ